MSSPIERARENATGIVSMLVTGIWLAALFTGQEWWLAFMLFGYIVVVPAVAILSGDEDDVTEWVDREGEDATAETENESQEDALGTLRNRYARGELTDEQFERKVEQLLETETLEDVEARKRRAREEESESGRGRERERERESE